MRRKFNTKNKNVCGIDAQADHSKAILAPTYSCQHKCALAVNALN
ncbi:hypothetical protein [Sessilibacter corallicola]|nr:hypothetical protein [Sessilibacter corallicola]